MHPPSSLSQLSHGEKDALILRMQEQTEALQENFEQLQARLDMNSRNSSKPPSQVFDLPLLAFDITAHRAMRAMRRWGDVHAGAFPGGVNAGVQYGSRAQAAMVHVKQNHTALMQGFIGLRASQATVVNAGRDSEAFEALALFGQFQGVLVNTFASLVAAFKGATPQPGFG